MNKNYFGSLHPAINFLYFTAVILFSMFFMHPVFLCISFVCGFTWSVLLNPRKALGFAVKIVFPMIAAMVIVNPLINHMGTTVLLYVNDNQITLESCFYGAAAAAMFSSVLFWFSCSNVVMTSEKFIYLFGRIIPSLSLMFSMVMRFVPRFKVQMKAISDAQEGIHKGVQTGNLFTRAQNGLKILSILTTWALEDGVTTADSMRARGYGLPNRSSFRIHRFDKRDKLILILLIVLIFFVLWGFFTGQNSIQYFPTIIMPPITLTGLLSAIVYFLLCAFPVFINAGFEVKYRGNF